MDSETVARHRAIESMRAGVPSHDVVTLIPPHQPDIESRFEQLLASMPDSGSRGVLLEGEFGGGKSHWLKFFESRAIASGFVCSTVALNKETPLYDLAKIYRACVLNSIAHDRTGAAIYDIVSDYNSDRAPGFNDFYRWAQAAQAEGKLDPRLTASLRLFAGTSDEDVRDDILNEWMGFPMKVGRFREALRSIGDEDRIGKHVPPNYLQRFEFIARLLISRGYKGWIILIDEAETISKYSLRQRAKAYAHLARLLGHKRSGAPHGIGSVATITKDYAATVLRGSRKHDLEEIPNKLIGGRDEAYVEDAITGMGSIDSKRLELRPVPKQHVEHVYQTISHLYSRAYSGWETPDVRDQREYSTTRRMREYVRSWINAWDLRRIYGYEVSAADMVFEDVKVSYDEDMDMQTESEDSQSPEVTF